MSYIHWYPGHIAKAQKQLKEKLNLVDVIIEGNKERTQAFEGTVIKKRGSSINKTITVRKVFQGIGVERVFAIYSPRIEKIQVLRRGDVRRAKLYYLRERSGKATRIREKMERR